MKAAPRRVSRRFPDYGWAWPRGDLDLLLKAIVHDDDMQALKMGLAWLAARDLDEASFSEHRLLAALADRFGRQLSSSPAWPRLVGLQRHLWTRSRLSLRDATSALQALSHAGIGFMVIKGASRVALDPGAQRGRVAHDIDIVVGRQNMGTAIAVLLEEGWVAASGAGRLRLEHEADRLRALNFFKGDFGDIDLHAVAYHVEQLDAADEERLWARSVPIIFAGVEARAPSAADRLALAIAHGALDAHRHSDWLVDIASCLRHGQVDWPDLLRTLSDRQLQIPAASALSYLAQETSCPIPPEALGVVLRMADGEGLRKRVPLIECKPRQDIGRVAELLRGIVKEIRLSRRRRGERHGRTDIWSSRIRRATPTTDEPILLAEFPVEVHGRTRIELSFTIKMPAKSRQMVWELSTDTQHLALLRYRPLRGGRGNSRLSFTGEVTLGPEDNRILLCARPLAPGRPVEVVEDMLPRAEVPFTDVKLHFLM